MVANKLLSSRQLYVTFLDRQLVIVALTASIELMQSNEKDLSIIVPVLNESGAITVLHGEIHTVCERLGLTYEIIIINDGSTDNTSEILDKLSPATIITFRKNFGQTAALQAGISQAKGKYLIALDGDGQNDPNDIPRLIDTLESGQFDVVSGWRRRRQDPLSKRLASKAAAYVRRRLINDGIHDSGCTLKIYRRECFDHVYLYGEMHRFIPALLKIKGYTIGEIEVNHRPRRTGYTKYNWKRAVKGNLDMLGVWFWKKYANRPLHLFGGIGALMIFVGLIIGVYTAYLKIFFHLDVTNTGLTLLSLFTLLIGLLFLGFGLLADILSKIYFAATDDQTYSVSKISQQ